MSEELENYEVSPGRQAVASKALGLINRSILSKDVHLSNAMSSITLRLTDSEYAKLKDSKEVTLINEVPKFEMEPSFPYHDFSHGGELVSWAKAAVNANDTRTTRNPFYFADLHPMHLQNTSEYNINLIYSTGVDPSYIYHSSAIALIVSGNRNSRLGRGINPGQPLFLTGTGGAEPAAYSHRGGISSRRSQRY